MEKTAGSTAKSILLLGVGFLIFLAPLKSGFIVDYDELGFPKNVFEWLIFQWPHGILQIGIIIIFTLWLTFSVFTGKLKIRHSFLDIVILIFLLTAVISAFKASNIHLARLCLTQYFIYALVYFLILNLPEDEKDFRYIFNMLIIPAALISLYAIYQYYIGLPQTRACASQYVSKELLESLKERLESNRVFSTFIYPNTLAGYLFLCIPLVLVCPNNKLGLRKACPRMAGVRKWLQILIVLVMLYALYLTFHRGSGSVDKIKNTSIVRYEYWTAGMKMIKDYPIFGIGPCNFGGLYPLYKLDIAEEVQYAHNNFLQIWAEQGIFGFLAFCAIWILVISRSFRVNAGLGLLVGLIAFLIHNLIDFDWYVPGLTIIAWVFTGMLVRMSGRYKEKIFYIKNLWIRGLILLCVISSFLLVLLCLEKKLIAEYYLREAHRAFENRNTNLTEVLGRASTRMGRDNPDVYFLLAQVCQSKGDYKNSIVWCKKALEYNPYCSAYYYQMALSYIYQMQTGGGMGLMKNVGEAFKEAVFFYPTKPFYHFELARFYDNNKQPDLALKEYNYCLELNNKIDRECKTRGKMLKHLVLDPDSRRNIEERIKKLQ